MSIKVRLCLYDQWRAKVFPGKGPKGKKWRYTFTPIAVFISKILYRFFPS